MNSYASPENERPLPLSPYCSPRQIGGLNLHCVYSTREFPTDIVCPHITFDAGPGGTKKFIISANSGKFVHLAEIGNGRSPLPNFAR